jgi:DNA transposition AAA+ family ATPase
MLKNELQINKIMTNLQQKTEIKEAINTYCTAKGISKNELATQIGVSSATLSQIEQGNWDKINDKMWRKIWVKVGSDTNNDIFETTDFAACTNACDKARNNRFMIGLVGDTGMGKTTALTTYAMRKNTFYLAYDKSMKPKQFFVSLLREMGISYEGSIHEMVNRIADELNQMDSPLVIIDEAGKIVHTMILYLHVLRDKTHKNCGIVLSGMPYFKSNLKKYSDKQKEGYSEFYRRIMIWHSLNGLSRNEIKTICESYRITDPDTIRELQPNKRFGDLYNAILLHQLQIKD